MDEHRLDWQQLDDILQVPHEGQIKNPNIFGLFICHIKIVGNNSLKNYCFKIIWNCFMISLKLFQYMFIFQLL